MLPNNFQDIEVRALWWKQPFATLMLDGKVETRTWETKYFGWVLICATQTPYAWKEVKDWAHIRLITAKGFEDLEYRPYVDQKKFPCGVAIAIGELTGCRKMIDEHDAFDAYVKFNPDLYCHFYKNVTPIEPFPIKGQQGWKTLSKEEKSLIKILNR
jgi:hypothetical protein